MAPVGKRMHVDPVKAAEQFKADLAAMKVGPKQGEAGAAPGSRLLCKIFKDAGQEHRTWQARLGVGHTFADAMNPTYWAYFAEKVMGHDVTNPKGRGDFIELRTADLSDCLILYVKEVGVGFIKVKPFKGTEPDIVDIPETSPLTLKFNPATLLYDVVRKTDNQVMKAGFQSEASGAAWINEHVAAMAA